MTSTETVRPWYTHFWLWFIILLPASVVVAGIITVIIAFENADSLVADNYYKEGLAINQLIARDKAATQLLLNADLDIDELIGELHVSLTGNLSVQPEVLHMAWIHPTSKQRDFSLKLRKTFSGQYLGQLEDQISGRWYLEISALEPTPWRLKTEVDVDKQSRIILTHSRPRELSDPDNSGGGT